MPNQFRWKTTLRSTAKLVDIIYTNVYKYMNIYKYILEKEV